MAEQELKNIKNVIAVGSGKGGVGKSTVAANLAAALTLAGKSVGLVDMDIYGPSVGKLFGIPGRIPMQAMDENTLLPVEKEGVKLMSFSFLLEEDQAVAWRGPLLNGAVRQLLFDIQWGELDYLIIDLPPGTGDVQLSLSQYISLDGAIVVSTPQSVALADAVRAISMFEKVNIPILGVIENMSEFVCPNCGHVTHIFSHAGTEEVVKKFGVPHLGNIPLQAEIMESGESGKPIVMDQPDGPVADSYREVIRKMEGEIEKYRMD